MTIEHQRPRKSLGKRILFFMLILAVLSGVAWFIVCWRIEQQVEQLLHQALEKHQLTDRVKWHGIRASPLGSVVLSDVEYRRSEHIQYRAKSLRISELVNQPDHFRLRLQLNEAHTVFSDEILQKLPASVSDRTKRPVNANMQVNLDFAADQGSGSVELLQQEGYDFAVQLDISKMAVLRKLLKERFPGLALSTDGSVGNAALGWLQVSINGLEASLHTRDRATGLAQPLDAGGHPQTIWQNGWKLLQESCAYAMPTQAQSCQHLTEFVQGRKNHLHLTAQPTQPVPLWRFIRFDQAAFRALNIQLK